MGLPFNNKEYSVGLIDWLTFYDFESHKILKKQTYFFPPHERSTNDPRPESRASNAHNHKRSSSKRSPLQQQLSP